MGSFPVRTPRRPRVLTIAGSDSGGGAGIQADLKTFSALGVYGMTAVTAVTVQNTRGVTDHLAMPPTLVRDQILSVTSDIGVDSAKTGMLADAAIVEAVADALGHARVPHLVIDPVIVSKHGHPLLAPGGVDMLTRELLPLATLVTPNLDEAAALTGLRVAGPEDMHDAAAAILALGAGAVLVKGGHLPGPAADLLADGREEIWLTRPRIDTPNTHGTGCTLSAAIAAHLAAGLTVGDAVRAAKAFVTEAIAHALDLGGGIGPVDQLWSIEAPRS
jgi:hydroxymethylpyrimidine/phosphomethylpyrimidine kinase